MQIITLLFILSILYYFILFNKQLELQKRQNELLEKILDTKKLNPHENEAIEDAMPHTEIEKLKTEFMKTHYKPPKK